jgi:HD-like signal output (HDOD) protein
MDRLTLVPGEAPPRQFTAEEERRRLHAERTAALAATLAEELHIDDRLQPLLEQAALLDHDVSPDLPAQVREMLAHFQGRPTAQTEAVHATLSHIIRTSHLVDRRLERLDERPLTMAQILEEMWGEVEAGRIGPEAAAGLQVFSTNIMEKFGDLPGRLAVNPLIAEQVRRVLLLRRECTPEKLEELAKTDPVLAASVIRVANSAIYNPLMRISRLPVAISFVGVEAAANAMIAAALQPLYVSAGLRRLWLHSLQIAQYCEALAAASGLAHPEESFLLGLVHDVGRLAIHHLPQVLVDRCMRLVDRGCPPTYAETVVFQAEHGEIGEAVLGSWGFPASVVEAVRNHHRPELSSSKGASLLYLAEWGVQSGEDIPSPARFRYAIAQTGLDPATLKGLAAAGRPLAALFTVNE